NIIVLANHGTVSYGDTVEHAYWWTEVLDAYCRMLMLSRGLGSVNYFTEPEAKALLELKQKWGYADPRNEMKNCDVCANDVFRDSWKATGVAPKAFVPPGQCELGAGEAGKPVDPASLDQEALIKLITDKVLAVMQGK
ncbi:MAG: class II aldolase/adducin family protein, partial [candidate division NC10 bacterium]